MITITDIKFNELPYKGEKDSAFEGKTIQNTTIECVEIKSGKFVRNISDGACVDVTEFSGTVAEYKAFVISESEKYIDNKY